MANTKSISKRDAVEKLRAQIEAARATAGAGLRMLSLEELAERCKTHPLGVNANGWKNPYPADDPRNLLLEHQFAFREDKSRFKFGLMARQTGKDFSSESEAAEDCHANPNTEWMIAAPSERQALDSLEQGKTWALGLGLKIADYQEQREGGSETLLKAAEITYPNKSRMRAVPGKPETVRGRSANVLLTEVDFFEKPRETLRAILPSITNPLRGGRKKLRGITTPNGAGGLAHQIWTKEDGQKMKWSKHFVTIYHAVLMGLPVDIEELREAFDDPDGFAQEYLCQFLDGSNVLLPYDVILPAESADATEIWDIEDAGHTHPTFCGIDFGRSNDPTVCWTLQLVGDVLWTREVLVLKNISSPEQELLLTNRIRQAQRTCFDYTGPGIGLGDYLVRPDKGLGRWKPEEHEFGKIELCVFTTKFKRENFPPLRARFKDAKGLCHIRIPISTTIREDLHEMQQVITNGEYNYWSRRTREGHSDRCTALMLASRAAGSGGACGPIHVFTHSRIGRVVAARRERSIAG